MISKPSLQPLLSGMGSLVCNLDSFFLELSRKDDPFIFEDYAVSCNCELWKDGSKTLNFGSFCLWDPSLSLLDECRYLFQSLVFTCGLCNSTNTHAVDGWCCMK